MTDYAVITDNLSFGYDKSVILKNISLKINRNRICFIMGNNGSGKTTLLKNLLGFLTPESGIINIADYDIKKVSKSLLSRLVSYVPQAINLNTDFSVIDYLALGRTPYIKIGKRISNEDYNIIDKYSGMLKVDELYSVPFNKLSGGQKQMVAIARSLIQDTPVLIMDEPMSALDLGKQADLLRLFSNLVHERKTIILTTHNPNHALTVESDSCFIEDGEVIAFGCSSNVITDELVSRIYGQDIVLEHGKKSDSIIFDVN